MRWLIDDQISHLPEVAGYVPLGVAFAQLVALECDEDPLDRDHIAESLNQSSPIQELLRWQQRLLQSGEMRSASRPIGGGSLQAIPPAHWHADDVRRRFLDSQYCREDAYSPGAKPDCWVFVREEDLARLWDLRKTAVLDEASVAISSKAEIKQRKRSVPVEPTSPALLLSLTEVEQMVGLRKSTIYKLIDLGRFPAQIKAGGRSLWRREDLIKWSEGADPET